MSSILSQAEMTAWRQDLCSVSGAGRRCTSDSQTCLKYNSACLNSFHCAGGRASAIPGEEVELGYTDKKTPPAIYIYRYIYICIDIDISIYILPKNKVLDMQSKHLSALFKDLITEFRRD